MGPGIQGQLDILEARR